MFLCPKCEMRDTHNSSSMFSCDECGNSYKHRSSLIAHKRLHNGGNNCPYCNKNFQKKEYLQSHIIKCEPLICGELQEFERETAIIIKSDFNDNDSAEKNSNEDVGKEKVDSQEEKALKTCEVCSKKVLRIDKHMQTHNTNVESCYICNKTFPHKRNLKQHMKNHDNTKVQDGLIFFYLIMHTIKVSMSQI